MRLVPMAILLVAGVCRAGDLNVHVMLSGEVAPGVYGQVQIGNERPPPLVYAQPMLIEPQAAPPPPIYLHVPPGHARNWRKHCREYNACNRPVYFVRSEEYRPQYERGDHDHEHDRSRHGEGDHDHEHRGHDRHDDK
ncbi:MAG TPA: hypothetical protein VGO37_18395 [Steroidobacteraceae bacterium]|nr:hypothetical protein [Steroidobacteraceae bacterium]